MQQPVRMSSGLLVVLQAVHAVKNGSAQAIPCQVLPYSADWQVETLQKSS